MRQELIKKCAHLKNMHNYRSDPEAALAMWYYNAGLHRFSSVDELPTAEEVPQMKDEKWPYKEDSPNEIDYTFIANNKWSKEETVKKQNLVKNLVEEIDSQFVDDETKSHLMEQYNRYTGRNIKDSISVGGNLLKSTDHSLLGCASCGVRYYSNKNKIIFLKKI